MKASKVGVRGRVRSELTLDEWVERVGGPAKTAVLLGVHVATVNYWRTGHCYPRVEQMREIRRLSKGLVTYEAMIDRAGQRR